MTEAGATPLVTGGGPPGQGYYCNNLGQDLGESLVAASRLCTDPNFFPIATWDQTPGSIDQVNLPTQNLPNEAAAGQAAHINLWIGDYNGFQADANNGADNLQAAYDYHQYYIADSPSDIKPGGADYSYFSSKPTAVQNDLIGYQLGDEASCTDPQAPVIAAAHQADSTRLTQDGEGAGAIDPGLIGDASCQAAYEANFNAPDITSADYYALTDEYHGVVCNSDCLHEYGDFAQASRAWNGDKKPYWEDVETGTNIGGGGDLPATSGSQYPQQAATLEQVNSATWDSIINGARGIIDFCDQFYPNTEVNSGGAMYGGGTGTDYGACLDYPVYRNNLAYVNGTVEDYAAVLNSPWINPSANGTPQFSSSVQNSTGPTAVNELVKQYGGNTYIFAQPNRSGSTGVKFSIPSLAGQTACVLYDSNAQYDNAPGVNEAGKTFGLDGQGSFSDAYPGDSSDTTAPSNYTVRIYEISANGTCAGPGRGGSQPLSITTTSLPAGTVGSAYSATLSATGGTPPISWSATGLPQGLSIDSSTGAITGAPTGIPGTASVHITATDSSTPTPQTASTTLSLTVNPVVVNEPLSITTTSLPAGMVGSAYSATLSATGGTPPISWSATGLPQGLSIDSSTGAITGAPTGIPGTASVHITATDSSTPTPQTASTTLSLTVNPAVQPGSPPGADFAVNTTGYGNDNVLSVSLPQSGISIGELLVAFLSADGPLSTAQSASISGAGLSWQEIERVNSQAGTAEIWAARVQQPLPSGGAVVSRLNQTGWFGTQLTVAGFSDGTIVGEAGGSAPTGAPSVALTNAAPDSFAYGVGHDWDQALPRTLASGQTLVSEWTNTQTGDDSWLQAAAVTSGGTFNVADTGPTTDRWDLATVDIATDAGPQPPPPTGVAPQVTLDQSVSTDGHGQTTTEPFNTQSAGEWLVAFTASDGPASGGQQTTVSGAGLQWHLYQRTNQQLGTAEVWAAWSPNPLTNATVTSAQLYGGYDQSLVVLTYENCAGIGAVASASAPKGAPSVQLTPQKSGSALLAVGNDWDNAIGRVPAFLQGLIHERIDTGVNDTYWVQASPFASTSGMSVNINDTEPTTDQWNLSAVEVLPS